MSRSYGSKCEPGVYRDTADIARDVRAEVKALRKLGAVGGGFDVPAETKISVRTRKFAGGSAIDVTVTGPAEWVYVKPGAPEGPEYYHQPAHGGYTVAASLAVKVIKHVVGQYNYDGSDIQTDYFDVNFYGSVDLGVLGTEFGHLRVDRSGAIEPVKIGEALGRFDSQVQEAWEALPYGAAVEAQRAATRAEQQAADAARYEAEQAEAAAAQDAEVEAFAAEVEAFEGNPGDAAELHDDVAWLEEADALADKLTDVAMAAVTIASAPDEVARMGMEGRAIQATWILDRHPGEGDAPGAPRELTELFVMYSKGRGYTATLNRATRQAPDGGPFTATMSSPLDAVRLDWSVPAPRFNRKALIEATKAAVAHVQDPANRERYLVKFTLAAQRAR